MFCKRIFRISSKPYPSTCLFDALRRTAPGGAPLQQKQQGHWRLGGSDDSTLRSALLIQTPGRKT
jgi:hypothetical protein